MLTFPTKNLFIEGPDCSGKTTLINKIHNESEYRWHIFDRSQISRGIFCSLYKREIDNIDFELHDDLSNLNNRFIMLIPDQDVIRERFDIRGDELHDISSLLEVWDAFSLESKYLSRYPNVQIRKESDTGIISRDVSLYLHALERSTLNEISQYVSEFVKNSSNFESYPLQFTIYDDGEFEEAKKESMYYEPESEYYNKIYKSLHRKIEDEIRGKNEYCRKESTSSRRFVYTDDSCISFIQVAIRSRVMDFHVVIRSSDVENTFEHDLKFLYLLASTCFSKFSDHCDKARIRFNLNSAHYIR